MRTNFANPDIRHVFVLMLENRSFDHMLGFSGLSGIDADTGTMRPVNGASANDVNVFNNTTFHLTTPADLIMPFDPGHEFPDVVEQLCGHGTQYLGGNYPSINNSGFVSNYASTKSPGEGGATSNFGEIMKCYAPGQLPVLTALAQEYAVCDNWFSSLPGPTWPNRFFVHASSAGGLDHSPTTVDILDWEFLSGFKFANGNIFQSLTAHGKNWRIYRGVASPLVGSIPPVAGLHGIKLSDTRPYENFTADVNGEYNFDYTFIEPNYGDIISGSYSGGQSEHPMDDVASGEALVKSTYEAIRNSPLWLSSLLIIPYDEHGGFYDHVAPQAADAPGDTQPGSKFNQFKFPFTRYGIRVPAIVISAYTPENMISGVLYDHSSIPATLQTIFQLPSLTKRDGVANDVTKLAALSQARNNTSTKLPAVNAAPPEAVAAAKKQQPAVNESLVSVDHGNLPGFLHVALKARLETHTPSMAIEPLREETADPLAKSMRDEIGFQVRTRAQARTYLEQHLPGLLGAK